MFDSRRYGFLQGVQDRNYYTDEGAAWHCFQTCVLPGVDKPVAVSTALARALLPLHSLGTGHG